MSPGILPGARWLIGQVEKGVRRRIAMMIGKILDTLS
jgi:hypothetical protein